MATRVDAAEAALDAYEAELRPMEHSHREYDGEAPDTRLVDLLADLMHYADALGIDFPKCVMIAEHHATAEPETAADYYNLAEFHERQGHTTEAAKMYERFEEMSAS